MHGSLCIDLVSMWAEFQAAVERLLEAMQRDDQLREKVLRRWRDRSWTVRPLALIQAQPVATGQP